MRAVVEARGQLADNVAEAQSEGGAAQRDLEEVADPLDDVGVAGQHRREKYLEHNDGRPVVE